MERIDRSKEVSLRNGFNRVDTSFHQRSVANNEKVHHRYTIIGFIAVGFVTARPQGAGTRTMDVFDTANTVHWVNNQAERIQTLTHQLDEFKHYESLFVDPEASRFA